MSRSLGRVCCRGLERTCRESWDPAEAEVMGPMADLGLE